MYLSPVEFVSIFNAPGVVAWAHSMGDAVPPNAEAVYQYLETKYRENPVQTLIKIKELHPHMQIIKEQLGDSAEKPATKQVVIKLAGRNKTFRNYTEVSDDGYVQQASDLINTGYEEGLHAVTNNKDHTNEILKLAGAFIAGAVLVKLFSK